MSFIWVECYLVWLMVVFLMIGVMLGVLWGGVVFFVVLFMLIVVGGLFVWFFLFFFILVLIGFLMVFVLFVILIWVFVGGWFFVGLVSGGGGLVVWQFGVIYLLEGYLIVEMMQCLVKEFGFLCIVYVCWYDVKDINVFVMGKDCDNVLIVVSKGVVENFIKDQLDVVIVYELGYVVNNDMV